jgi:hypothetical protein
MTRHGDAWSADDDAPSERQWHRHSVPGVQQEPSCRTGGEWHDRNIGQGSELCHPGRGLAPRAFRPIRRDTNEMSLSEFKQKISQNGRAAAGGGSQDGQNAEAPDNRTNEAAVAVLADQGINRRRTIER